MSASMVGYLQLHVLTVLTFGCLAYQSALVTTPLVLFRIFGSLVGFSFLNTLLTIWIVLMQAFMAYVIP